MTIAGLDEALGENIHPSQNVLLLGPPPSGKFTLAIQFLASGLRARECALLVTTADTPSAIKKRVRATGWNLEGYEKQGELMYVTCHRTDGTAAGVTASTERENLENTLVKISSIISGFQGQGRKLRFVFDNLTTLLDHNGFRNVAMFRHQLMGI